MGQENNGNLGAGRISRPQGTGGTQQVVFSATGTLPVAQVNGPVQTATTQQALDRFLQGKLVTTTFLGIPVTVHTKMADCLRAAQDSLKYNDNQQKHGIVSLTGKQPRPSWLHSVGCAVDINYETSPFLMHEEGEGNYDVELAQVYERIAQFILGRASVIPLEITQYNASKDRRDYLYEKMKQESDAMRTYFGLYMRQPEAQLDPYLATPTGADRARHTNWKVGVPPGTVPTWQMAFRQIQRDYVMLTGRDGGPQVLMSGVSGRFQGWRNPCDVGMCYPAGPSLSREAGARRNEDAPFTNKNNPAIRRDPQNGFLSFDHDVVAALTDAGLTWGAIGFGAGGLRVGGSGDVMHFELTTYGKVVYDAARAAVPGF